jgi:hypothetical protein
MFAVSRMSSDPSRLRNRDQFVKSLRSFQWLGETGSGATDLDFLMERRGQFLVLEGKHWDDGHGLYIPFGQHIALKQLALIPAFTLYLVGDGMGEDKFYVMRFGKAAPLGLIGTRCFYPKGLFDEVTADGLRTIVRDWRASV